MRKLIFAINLTLDGCCDHTKGNPDEEVHDYFTELMDEVDLFLYGRITYELMVPFWPDMAKNKSGETKSMNDFAQKFDSIDRVVFSRTLKSAEPQTRIISSNLRDEVLALKQQPGKSILMGGVDLPRQLIELDLVDEFHFVMQPLVVGEGRRLFDDANFKDRLLLKLEETKVFGSGGVALRYRK